MRIAQAGDEVGELEMERVVGELVDLRTQNAQSLHRIGAVTCPLQRQVRVDAVDHRLDAFDQPQPLGSWSACPGDRNGPVSATAPLGLRFAPLVLIASPPMVLEGVGEHDPALGDSDPIGGHDLPPQCVLRWERLP